MSDSVEMTVRLSRKTKERLEALADTTRRSETRLVAEAVEAYLELEAWQVEGIRNALEKADRGGPFVAQEDVKRWLKSWSAEDELEPPRAREVG